MAGDVSRGIVARGKKADGRDENSGYKFVSDLYLHLISLLIFSSHLMVLSPLLLDILFIAG